MKAYIRQDMNEHRDLADSIQDLILLFDKDKGRS